MNLNLSFPALCNMPLNFTTIFSFLEWQERKLLRLGNMRRQSLISVNASNNSHIYGEYSKSSLCYLVGVAISHKKELINCQKKESIPT